MNDFKRKIKLPENSLPDDYIKDKKCFDCDMELVNDNNVLNMVYDIHNLICPKCKSKYIKCARTGFLKRISNENN
jgi:hypothetical protein